MEHLTLKIKTSHYSFLLEDVYWIKSLYLILLIIHINRNQINKIYIYLEKNYKGSIVGPKVKPYFG